MEEESENKYFRQSIKELRHEFLEENDCDEVSPVLQRCCAEPLENFNEQTHDAWLMQCPKGMDIQRMVDKRIKLPGRRYVEDLKVRGKNYGKPLIEAVGYVNSKGKYVLGKLPLAGLVVVSKRLNVHQTAEGQNGLDSGSKFPTARPPLRYRLPVRHPYYGRDYKRHIQLPAATSEALKRACRQNEKAEVEMQRSADYYTLKKLMMRTTQTLEEKEREVRQSVISGHTPRFMKETDAPSHTAASAVVNIIKSMPKGNNDVVQTNGHDLVEIKTEPMTTPKKKKRKSNGEILVNGSVSLANSLVTIKEEPEQSPQKRRKRKDKASESVSLDGNVVVTIKEEPDLPPEKRRKREAKASESVSFENVEVTIKKEPELSPEKRRKRKDKTRESVSLDETVEVTIKEEPDLPPGEKRRKQKAKKLKSVA